MSKRNTPKFKIYSKFGSKLTDHPKLTSSKLKSKKWQFLFSSNRRPRKETEYGSVLRAKQRLNAFYGGINNKQLTTLFIKAGQYKGNQTINFIKLLERRLDVFLFRSKLSPSLHEIRQLIQHGHFLINGSVVKTASLLLKKNDRISVKAESIDLLKNKVNRYFSQIIHNNKISKKMSMAQIVRNNPILFVPNYIEFNHYLMEGQLVELPDVENICYPMNPDLTPLMEYYKHIKKV
jgi:small subunit ribosomal protein S4